MLANSYNAFFLSPSETENTEFFLETKDEIQYDDRVIVNIVTESNYFFVQEWTHDFSFFLCKTDQFKRLSAKCEKKERKKKEF